LPEKENYQFYAPVLSAEDFMREPYISGEFFQCGLALKEDKPEYNNTISEELNFELTARNSNINISSELRTPRQVDVEGASWVERKGNTFTFRFDLPAAGEYKGHIFARLNNEVRLQNKIDIGTFEGQWLPDAGSLLQEKKINKTEMDLFEQSYFMVEENNSYYFIEDQFDTARNNAVLKIHQLLELSTGWMDNILDVTIRAAPGYAGFGRDGKKYPGTFSAYNHVPNTQLIAPISGTLQSGSTETFIVSSRDYTAVAIIINDQWYRFTKNSRTGNFELTLEIPAGINNLTIYGTKGNRSYTGLVQYDIL
jgi:hypothetical protein